MSTYGGAHHLQIHAFAGWDVWMYLAPRWLVLRRTAKKILRHWGHTGEWVPAGAFTFSLPGEAAPFEIIDGRGHTRPYRQGATP